MAFFLPIGLTVLGVIVMIIAYTNMRQGGARVYTLEREAILRRSAAAMFLGTGLFVLTISWLLYLQQVTNSAETVADEAAPAVPAENTTTENTDTDQMDSEPAMVDDNILPTPVGTIQIPPITTAIATPTLDPDLPTATPTPVIIRAFVINTGGNGLTMRDVPGGEQVLVIQEDEFITVLEDEGTADVNGFIWVKVRTFLGEEGWVARDFLAIENQ